MSQFGINMAKPENNDFLSLLNQHQEAEIRQAKEAQMNVLKAPEGLFYNCHHGIIQFDFSYTALYEARESAQLR